MSDGSVIIEVALTKKQLEEGLKSLDKDISSLEKATSGISDKLSKGLDTIGGVATKAGKALTVGLTTPLIALGTAGVQYNAQMEDFEANLTTLLGSADKAKDMLETLKQMANTTPFETSDLLEATQMMLGFGLEADKTTGYLQTLGDISMGNSEKLMSLTRAFSQIGASGKATMEDINQMIDAGFNPLQIISEKTGKSMADLRDEVSDGKISFEDIAGAMKDATSEGGRYYKSMEKASQTMNGKLSTAMDALKTALGNLTKSLLPIVTKVVEKITEWANAFANLDDKTQGTILKITGVAIAMGPVLTVVGKLTSGLGSVVKVFGTFSKALNVASGLTTSTSTAVNLLAKVFGGLASPVGLASTLVVSAIAGIAIALNDTTKETEEAFTNMGNSANEFISGIKTAKSHLSEFNSTLFASTEEQQRLQDEMQEIQNGITQICKTASDERRGYTQEEITQLDEYFTKLRDLKNQEIAIQSSIATAITQQATTNAQAFQGSLEEYKVQSQEWINTAIQQRDATLQLIQDGTTQEIALLNQKYGEQANMQNEAYATEYNNIIAQQQQKIDAANQEVASVAQVYANGYLERASQNDGFYAKIQEYNAKLEEENNRHNSAIQGIEDNALLTQYNKNASKEDENYRHKEEMKDIWNEMYKNMSEEQENELGVWLAQVAQTEMYGGQIDDKTRELVGSILESYESMPKDTQEAMKNAMSPMLEEMKKSEPSLFAKAQGIADGILSRLKKSFDIHSPSKKTRNIFRDVMKGSELGLEDEEKNIYKQVQKISKGILSKFNASTLCEKMKTAVDFETQKLSASLTTQATFKANKDNVRTVNNDNGTVINNTQNFYEKNATPYEEQKQARQQLRRLAYGL